MASAIVVEGLSKRYQIGELQASYGTLRDSVVRRMKGAVHRHAHHDEHVWALEDVSFEVAEGEVLGLIGRNGAGKSTLLRVLTRITSPTSGTARIRGRMGSLLEVGTGFHPELTGRENVFLNGAILGMRRREIAAKFDDIVDFSGTGRFVDTPVKRYSSGMYVRLAFAVAAFLEPEILLVDEVLAVGDAEFQRRCLGRMEDMGESGRTVVFVSHNMQTIVQLCDRAILLDGGRMVSDGNSADVVAEYLQSGLGSSSYREWPDDDAAPGDGVARLRFARIVGEDGEQLNSADARARVGVEIGYRVLRPEPATFAKLKVTDRRGDIAFNALDTRTAELQVSVPGEYVATAWLPGNLLNEGLTAIDVELVSLGPKLQHHAQERQALSFHVVDSGEGDSARGPFVGQLRGVVRPLLDWTVEQR